MTNAHPCFSPDARSSHSRLHLPVAAVENMRLRYVDAMANALRAGGAIGAFSTKSEVLVMTPAEALEYVAGVVESGIMPEVIGITGPAEPFAAPDPTFATLEKLRAAYPDVSLCVTTNGMGVAAHAERLTGLVSHVTITVNAVSVELVERLYAWIRPGKRTVPLREAATLLIAEQGKAIRALKEAGITVKVNATVYPEINETHMGEVAAWAARMGAEIMHIMPYQPPWNPDASSAAGLSAPAPEAMDKAREDAAEHITLMDAPDFCGGMIVGRAGESCGSSSAAANNTGDTSGKASGQSDGETCCGCGYDAMTASNASEHPDATCSIGKGAPALPVPSGDRPNVAVASSNGVDVNLHLGQTPKFMIYGPLNGPVSLLEVRHAPAPGSEARWETLSEILSDCRYLLVESAGGKPREILAEHGIRVIQTDEEVEGLVDALYGGGKKGKCRK